MAPAAAMSWPGYVRDDSASCSADSSANNRTAGRTSSDTTDERATRAAEKRALGHTRISGIGTRSDRQRYNAQYDDIFHVGLPVKASKCTCADHQSDPL
ncbi:hypothetical protein [Labrys neptuniae]